jgi:hypothetical protein
MVGHCLFIGNDQCKARVMKENIILSGTKDLANLKFSLGQNFPKSGSKLLVEQWEGTK